MKYEIIELHPLTGKQTKIYSIVPEGAEESLFEQFLAQYEQGYSNEIKEMVQRLYVMGHQTGARYSFFKEHEGRYGDFVCALYDIPRKMLRLYCIRMGTEVIILGRGAPKPKHIISWQQDSDLKEAATQLIEYASDIMQKIDKGIIYWSEDHKELIINFNNEEIE